MKIKLLERRVFTDAGAIVDYREDLARRLIKEGRAELCPSESAKKSADKTVDDPKPADQAPPAKEPVPAGLVPQPREQEHMTPRPGRKKGPWK